MVLSDALELGLEPNDLGKQLDGLSMIVSGHGTEAQGLAVYPIKVILADHAVFYFWGFHLFLERRAAHRSFMS